MDILKALWVKFRGIAIVTGVTTLLGIGAVATSIGVELVDGPDGSVCIQASAASAVTE